MFSVQPQRILNSPLAWTSAALVGGILLHIDRVPGWASAAALLCVAWRIAAELRLVPLPRRAAKVGIALLLIAAVYARFRTLNGLSAGSALLVVMSSIKLLETQSRRDRFVVIGTTFFILLAAVLDRQSILRAPLYLLQAWLCCAALAAISNQSGGINNRGAALLAARSLAMSLPLAVALFLFFPRMVGAFWVLPQGDAAVTGLSDSMSPGGISSLSESDDPAFRVTFIGDTPPPEERYWRGPVLHDFDGYTWTRGRVQVPPKLEPAGPLYRYRVQLEASSQPYWFALDTVTASPSRRVTLWYDHTLTSSQPVTSTTIYEATSYTRTRTSGPIFTTTRKYDTEYPRNRNVKSAQLAQEMRGRVRSDEEYISDVLAFFRNNGFEYTLTPPRLDFDSVDDFLFNTKRGFCGHYASAFVMMMRAAAVPARVVTGYQGGEWNPIGEYWLIRQSDAHAWAEVWLDGRGWTRVDPTAVVSPERLRRGIFDLIPSSLSAPGRLMRDTPWLADVRLRWDALNNWWNQRVLRFDYGTQIDLLKWFGIQDPDWRALGWLFGGGLVLWLLVIAWQVGRALRATPMDRLARAYTRLCRKLARAGAPREPHEGPLAYATAVARHRPDLTESVRALLSRYAELRYGTAASADARSPDVIAFERAVARLRIRRAT
jgi:transglutaminase-like putative cysteine protease